jgi:hypothetical protein
MFVMYNLLSSIPINDILRHEDPKSSKIRVEYINFFEVHERFSSFTPLSYDHTRPEFDVSSSKA